MIKVPFLDIRAGIEEQRAELDAAWARVLDSGQYILGDELLAFETGFAALAGCDHAIGVGNGLDALALALLAAGIGPGDEVIVPAHTFIATWLSVDMVGARPVPAEPDDSSYNATVKTIEAALTPRTKAIVPVHLYGEPTEIEAIAALAASRGLVLLEDAAQAHGALRNARPIGSFGQAAAFSFYPAKNLGALGDAGAVTTNDPDLAERLRLLRNYGSVKKYEHNAWGRNSRLDPLQAAILNVRLARLHTWNSRRRAIAARYDAGLGGIDGLGLPQSDPANTPVWHIYAVTTDDRDALAAYLGDRGIGTQIHYPLPVYRFAVFDQHGPSGETPSDRLCRQLLSLPIGPQQSEEQTDYVIETVRGFFAAH